MPKYIDIVSKTCHANRIEIILSEQCHQVLEAYSNPSKELRVDYRVVYDDTAQGKLYMEAMVVDQQTLTPVVKCDYVLGDENLTISNVISFKDDKSMWTSSGAQGGAADLGHSAVKWLFQNILSDARDRGFDHAKITSSTRYSGARAKNGAQTSSSEVPVNYSVDQKIVERFVYSLQDGIVFLD